MNSKMSDSAASAGPAIDRRGDFFGPVLRWEFVSTARRKWFFITRALYAAALLIVLITTFASWGSVTSVGIRGLARFADDFSQYFLNTQLFTATFLTPSLFAPMIASERERRTIDYLFASDLSNREIVWGKFLIRLAQLGCILISAVPVVACAALLGGVSYAAIFQVTGITIVAVLSAASISLLVSVYSRTTRQALVRAYSLLFLFLLLPLLSLPLFYLILGRAHMSVFGGEEWFYLNGANPILISWMILDPVGYVGVSGTRVRMAVLGSTFLAFHVATILLSLTWSVYRLRKALTPTVANSERRTRLSNKLEGFLQRLRPRVWDRWPIAWREAFARSGSRREYLVWLLLSVVTIAVYVGMVVELLEAAADDRLTHAAGGMVRSASALFFGFSYIFVLFRSSTAVGEERNRDTWVSLLATPVPCHQILWQKVFTGLTPLTIGMLASLPAWLLGVFVGAVRVEGIILTFSVAALVGFALSALGVSQSLLQPTVLRSIVVTASVAVFFGGLGQSLLMASRLFSWADDGSYISATVYWVGIGWTVMTRPMTSREESCLFCACVSAWVYALGGVFLVKHATRQFPKVTGRTEEVLARDRTRPADDLEA